MLTKAIACSQPRISATLAGINFNLLLSHHKLTQLLISSIFMIDMKFIWYILIFGKGARRFAQVFFCPLRLPPLQRGHSHLQVLKQSLSSIEWEWEWEWRRGWEGGHLQPQKAFSKDTEIEKRHWKFLFTFCCKYFLRFINAHLDLGLDTANTVWPERTK